MQELKQLALILNESYVFENDSVRPQSEDINIISTVNLIENTQTSYSKLLKIYTTGPKIIFEQLPTLKSY